MGSRLKPTTKRQRDVKQFVFMAPDGRLAIGIPFSYFQRPEDEEIDSMPGYRIMISPKKPEAWALKISEAEFFTLMLPFALKNLKHLGVL